MKYQYLLIKLEDYLTKANILNEDETPVYNETSDEITCEVTGESRRVFLRLQFGNKGNYGVTISELEDNLEIATQKAIKYELEDLDKDALFNDYYHQEDISPFVLVDDIEQDIEEINSNVYI